MGRRSFRPKRFESNARRLLSVEQLEARRLLTTNIGIVRPDGSDVLQWELDNESLTGTRNTAAEISFDYGLKAGAPGAGSNGNDDVLAGDLSGVGFDQAIAVRGVGGALQWLGDTDRDTDDEYRFRFGLDTFKPLIADMNGDGFDDIVAVDLGNATAPTNLVKWYVHYRDPNGNPAQQGGGFTDYFSDGTVAADAEFSFGFNSTEATVTVDDIPLVGDFNGDGRADVAVARNNGSFLTHYIAYADSGAVPYPGSVLTTLTVDQTFAFGSPNAIPVAGDWDNDGDDNIGVIREGLGVGGSSQWLLDTDYSGGTDIALDYGNTGDQYLVGNWADVLWDGNQDGDGDGTTWAVADNWSGGVVPTSGQGVVIDQPTTASTINIGTSTSTGSVVATEKVSFNNGTWTLAENSSLLNGLDIGGSTFAPAGTVTIRGTSDWGGVTLSGAGVTVNEGTINYDSGTLTVNAGASLVNAGTFNHTANSTVRIDGTLTTSLYTLPAGRLEGSGAINGSLVANSGATVAPGNSPGILNTGDFSLLAGSTLEIEIGGVNAGNTATDHDQLNVTGTVTLAGDLTAVRFNGFNPAAGNEFIIINNDGVDAVSGTFNGLGEGATFISESVTYSVSYVGGDGNDVVLTAQYMTFVVTNTAGSGAGSLQQALLDANAVAGPDLITFEVAGPLLVASIPQITDTVKIDATTAPGYAGAPTLELQGDFAGNVSGLSFTAGSQGSVVEGLSITAFQQYGISITADNVTVSGNWIGVNLSGSADGNAVGIGISAGATNNTIGGVGPISANVISGNTGYGIGITDVGTTGNRVIGNFVGTDAAGTAAIPNGPQGIAILAGASNNFIGTNGDGIDDTLERNLISGNQTNGIWLTGTGTTANVIAGNYIGTDITGNVALGNGHSGIWMSAGASGNIIGTDGSGDAFDVNEGNLISGNGHSGIYLTDSGTNSNVFAGNIIGLTATGDAVLGNNHSGIVFINGASNNLVGTNGDGVSDLAERNIISANLQSGIRIEGSSTTGNSVAGNYIGTDITGTINRGNVQRGIWIRGGASDTFIGTNADGLSDELERNVVSGNLRGIEVSQNNTTGTQISGNYIGTASNGVLPLGNSEYGVFLFGGSSQAIVGTNGDGVGDLIEANVISGNLLNGVLVSTGSYDVTVAGNLIGTDKTGSISVGNGIGVEVSNSYSVLVGSDGNGASDAAERNVISGNTSHGILVQGASATGNTIAGNYIGTDVTGTLDLGNVVDGVQIWGEATNNLIGTNGDGVGDEAERNVISGNERIGIYIVGAGTDSNTVAGNYIGTDATGAAAIANLHGVAVGFDAKNNRVGTDGNGSGDIAERNVLSGNNTYGLWLYQVSQNVVAGNFVGTDVTGTQSLGNASHGVVISGVAYSNLIGTNGDGVGDDVERNVISGNSQNGIFIGAAGSNSNIVAGNFIGTDITGTQNLGNAVHGIRIQNGASENIIGTNGSDDVFNANERNVIAGNLGWTNISITNEGTDRNVIAGNYIGVDATGTMALNGSGHSIAIQSGPDDTRVGTDGDGLYDALERNVIAGAPLSFVVEGTGTERTVIAGNYVGTNAAGDVALSGGGIEVRFGAQNTRIGTDGSDDSFNAGERNVISGTSWAGIFAYTPNWDGTMPAGGATTDGTVVAGNYIGVNAAGTATLGNAFAGVLAHSQTTNMRIGTNNDGVADDIERNVISGNSDSGILVEGWTMLSAKVADEFIAGNAATTSVTAVVTSADFSDATGPSSGSWPDDNPIPGDGGDFYVLQATGTLEVATAGTFTFALGADNGARLRIDGVDAIVYDVPNQPFSNLFADVTLTAGTHTFELVGFEQAGDAGFEVSVAVGGGVTGPVDEGNGWRVLGAGNPHAEIALSGTITATTYYPEPGGLNVTIAGNYIGTDPAGTLDWGNGRSGVTVNTRAQGVTIGGSTAEARNVISGNDLDGITILGRGTNNNWVAGNYIGTNATGTAAVGNLGHGITVSDGASNVVIGGPDLGQRNIVSGNVGSGVAVVAAGPSVRVQGNYIGTDRTSLLAIGNASTAASSEAGIKITSMTGIPVIVGTDGDELGDDENEGNVISGNFRFGVLVEDTDDHVIAGNRIGVDFSGTVEVPNQIAGIFISASSDIRIGTNSDGQSDSFESNIISGNRNLETGPDETGVQAAGIWITDPIPDDSQASAGAIIAGNFIGTDRSTNLDLGNQNGILAEYALNVRIGGTLESDRNYIGNSDGFGIAIIGTSGAMVSRNSVGVTASGGAMGHGGAGITLAANTGIDTTTTTIGGITPELGNTIGYNNQGLWLQDQTSTTGSLNVFENNLFNDNFGLSIDVGAAGPTFNDGLEGANELHDYPVITSADIDGAELVIQGLAQPGRAIDLYVSEATFTTRGHGTELLAAFNEGDASDLNTTTGSYAAPHTNGTTVSANQFEVRISVPATVSFGTLLTAITVGSTSEFGNVVQVGQIVANSAPLVTLGAIPSLIVGEAFTFVGSFTDADSSSWTATVDYGDGGGEKPLALSTNNTYVLSHVYNATSGSPYTITVRVRDGGGQLGIATTAVAVANSAPEVTFNNVTFTSVVNERSEAKIAGSFTDTGITDSHSVVIDWGDGTTSSHPINLGSRSFEATHSYADDGDSRTVRDTYRASVTITDNLASNVTPLGLYTIEVVNVRPGGLVVNAPSTVVEGDVAVLTGSFSDPGLSDAHTIRIDWGDNNIEIIELPSIAGQSEVRSFAAQHVYANNTKAPALGFEVSVQVVDDDEPATPTEVLRTIQVTNALPTAPVLTLSATGAIDENSTISLGVTFSDAGLNDHHTIVVDWGDESELQTIELAPGELSLDELLHTYRDDPSQSSDYTITVRVRDADMPTGEFVTSIASVTVDNIAPQINSLELLVLDGNNSWTAVTGIAQINEGDHVRIAGAYSDKGPDDLHDVLVTWSPGRTTYAVVNPEARTFVAEFRYVDDFAAGTSSDVESITVALADRDGLGTTANRQVQVNNVAPSVFFVSAVGATETSVRLVSEVFDPGFEAAPELEPLTYAWALQLNGTEQLTASTPDFTFNPSMYSGSVVVRLTVVDDDAGAQAYESAFKFGTAQRDYMPVTDADFASGVNALSVISFGGADVVDATQVTAGRSVILDGSSGTDYLFGGSGDDIYVLRDGDDAANVGPSGTVEVDDGEGGTTTVALPQSNEQGNDRYLLAPNSMLTVVDHSGLNTLDFALADFGVTFDLSATRTATMTTQDVAPTTDPSRHYIAAQGQFNTLAGSNFGDSLTAASGTTATPTKIVGGGGADHLFANAGTRFASFSGGNDADILSLSGVGVGDINFEGDLGTDELVIFGEATNITFGGGADTDTLTISPGSIAGGIDFAGDLGADHLLIFGTATDIVFDGGADADVLTLQGGSVSAGINFEGDLGTDELIVLGSATGIVFGGGADSDILNVGADSVVTDINFEGDVGADQLIVFGDSTGIIFTGGADTDTLTVALGGSASDITFEGDLGTDELVVFGSASGIVFEGGADVDRFVIESGASLVSGLNTSTSAGATSEQIGLRFIGDAGADQLVILGEAADITFSGGADADTLTIGTTGIGGDINFNGDAGANQLIVYGSASDINFGGGADADTLTIQSTGFGTNIVFTGDTGTNSLLVFGESSNIVFNGGADSDVLAIGSTGTGSSIDFTGDTGTDELIVFGNASDIMFGGGADTDTLTISGVASDIVFNGDIGADALVVFGSATDLDFNGGADADTLTVSGAGSVSDIGFDGDLGTDELIIFGDAGGIIFDGGADADRLVISGSGGVTQRSHTSALSDGIAVPLGIRFVGDIGTDELIVFGSASHIDFDGGADADVLAIAKTGSVGDIDFQGDSGADILVNLSDGVGKIVFFGGADADVLRSLGNNVGDITFDGDTGADSLIIDGVGIGDILFSGGADADVLSTAGSDFGNINFEGDTDDGNLLNDDKDTLFNRGTARVGAKISFNGYGGLDVLRNDGNNWAAITFHGDSGADVLVNNGAGIGEISFEGDLGTDILENNGVDIGAIVFNGGADADILANDGFGIAHIIFSGGSDGDYLQNTGSEVSDISFDGDAGDDVLVNTAAGVSGIVFEGDDGDDRFTNSGADLSNVVFYGGAGNDRFSNLSSATGSSNLIFRSESYSGGMGAVPTYPASVSIPRIVAGTLKDDTGVDQLINLADSVVGILFEGGADADILQNAGVGVSDIVFNGDLGDDQLLNTGSSLSDITFTGDAGNDIAENRGSGTTNFVMLGGIGNDTLVNRGNSADGIVLNGGVGNDVFLNQGNKSLLVSMVGGAGDDRFQNDGSDIDTLSFDMGDDPDIFQNNGSRINMLDVQGGDGADIVFNNGDAIKLIRFIGGGGSDSLINSGADIGDPQASLTTPTGILFEGNDGEDLLRIQNSEIARVEFSGGAGNDTLLHNGYGGTTSFFGGMGNDVLTVRGAIDSLAYYGEEGNDDFILSGTIGPKNAMGPTANVDGGAGNDRYEFSVKPAAWVWVGEAYNATSDDSIDSFDFSAFVSTGIDLDLSTTIAQPQPSSNLTIQLSDALGLENVIGSSGSDTIGGNGRVNDLGGEEFFEQTLSPPVASRSQTQWVYLDFDTFTDPNLEYDYTQSDRDEIMARMQEIYYGGEAIEYAATTGSDPYFAPSRWFNIRFTQDLADIPQTIFSANDFIRANFNKTPTFDRPGGQASEVDFANRSFTGSASIQINGLLGGILTAEEIESDDYEDLYADAAVGSQKPAAIRENFVALATKVAAHEIAHLFGLRHYDAFGPIGFGIHSPPGAGEFKPGYSGPAAAFETFDHIIGSPASVGSNRFIDLGKLFFGEREAIKVTLATSDLTTVSHAETTADHSDSASAQLLSWATLAVPNTLNSGVNADKDFFVQAAIVSGAIGIAGTTSESDFYKIAGQAGDLITIEVSSRALRRFTDMGVDGYIDSVLRLYDSTGEPVAFYNTPAFNDDEFESTDSVLLDVRLPATGDYILEVDTFKSPDAFDQTIADQLSGDILQLYIDSTADTDIGAYELLVYKFATANSEDIATDSVGNDVVSVSELNFGRIVGGIGSNTLRLDGSGLSLDLTTMEDNRIVGFEEVDITGVGNNTLTLDHAKVLTLSGKSDALIVRRDLGDLVNIGSGWIAGADETIGADVFNQYTQGSASLKVQVINNDVPSASSSSVSTLEDIAYAFDPSDFGFADENQGDSLSAVVVTTLENDGALQWHDGLSWLDVIVDQEISATDISAGKLRFVPVPDSSGSPYSTFDFKVKDTFGPDLSANAKVMTVNVAPVNDKPLADSQTVTAVEHRELAITLTGSDGDADATQNLIYRITSLPTTGELRASEGGDRITSVPFDLEGAEIFFKPAAGFFEQQIFNFTVQDDGLTTNGGVNSSDPASVTVVIKPSGVSALIDVEGQVVSLNDPDADTQSNISLSVISGKLRFSELSGAPLSAGEGVSQISSSEVEVDSPATLLTMVDVNLGAEADKLTIVGELHVPVRANEIGDLEIVEISDSSTLTVSGALSARVVGISATSRLSTSGNAQVGDGSPNGLTTLGPVTVNTGHHLTVVDSDGSVFVDETIVNGELTILNLNNSAPGSLVGTGTIHGDVSGSGFFSPTMQMTINGNFAPSGIVEFFVNRIFATPGTDNDQYLVNDGRVDLSGATIRFMHTLAGTATELPVMTLIDSRSTTDTTSGSNPAAGEIITIGGSFYQLSYTAGSNNNDVVLTQVGGISYDQLTDELTVFGSNQSDAFRIQDLGSGVIEIRGSFADVGSAALTMDTLDQPVTQITAILYDGNDVADVRVNIPTIIIGGNGNDSLRMSGGVGILVGGPGTDSLRGNDRSMILIGGDDEDKIIGSSQRDIIVGGIAANELDPAALERALSYLAPLHFDLVNALDELGAITDEKAIDDMIGRGGLDEILFGSNDRWIQ